MPAWASLARIAAACRHDPCNIVIRACRLRPTWQPCGLSTPAWSRSQSCLTAPRCLTPLRRPSAPPGMSLQRCRLCGAKQRRRRPASLLGTSRWVPRACSAQAGWCTGPLAILCCTCAAWVKPACRLIVPLQLPLSTSTHAAVHGGGCAGAGRGCQVPGQGGQGAAQGGARAR